MAHIGEEARFRPACRLRTLALIKQFHLIALALADIACDANNFLGARAIAIDGTAKRRFKPDVMPVAVAEAVIHLHRLAPQRTLDERITRPREVGWMNMLFGNRLSDKFLWRASENDFGSR